MLCGKDFFHVVFVEIGRGEKGGLHFALQADLNARSGGIGCNTAVSVPRLRADAALANTRRGNGGNIGTGGKPAIRRTCRQEARTCPL